MVDEKPKIFEVGLADANNLKVDLDNYFKELKDAPADKEVMLTFVKKLNALEEAFVARAGMLIQRTQNEIVQTERLQRLISVAADAAATVEGAVRQEMQKVQQSSNDWQLHNNTDKIIGDLAKTLKHKV